MKREHRFDAGPFGGWLAGLASVVLVLGVVSSALGDLPKDLKGTRPSRSLGLATTASRETLDRNRVIFLLTDVGEIGSSGSSVAGGGFWIATTNQYIFSSGPNIGATAPSTTAGKRDTVVFIGGPFSELDNGSLVFPELGVFWDSTNPDDAANFPEVCTVDDFRVQQFPTLQPFAGEPFPGFSDQTICIAVNDITGAPCSDCAGKRLGAEVVETDFVFGVPSVQDFVFVAMRIFNRTEFLTAANAPTQPTSQAPWDLEDVTVAIAVDADVGNAGDDQTTIFPEINTMVFWDSDFTEPQFQGIPGFAGVTYLQTPIGQDGEPVGLQNFTVFTNGGTRPDPNSAQEWYQGMTGDPSFVRFEVTPQDIRGMAASGLFTLPANEFQEIYAAYFFANVAGSPPTQLLAQNPNNPGANTSPAFDNLLATQLTAQATFDAGFVVPTAPPKPDFKLIPGDHQVTIVWDAGPVQAVNPFAKVARDPFKRLADGSPDPDAEGTGIFLAAGDVVYVSSRDTGGLTGFVTASEAGLTGREVTNAAYNPNFVIQDFQGFKVYRSRTGLASDAELISQFDLNDAIVGGLFCTAATPVFDTGGEFVSSVCTSSSQLDLGTNTGLGFSVIDRGGSFPDPSTGPGLINGIPVFYTVTSYAVNTGETPVDLPSQEALDVLVPPAAPLVLEAGLSPLQQVTPESNPSSLKAAVVGDVTLKGDDGTVIDAPGPIPVADGALAGPIPGARDYDVAVQVVQPTEIPSDFELQVHVDAMDMTSAFNTGFCGGAFNVPGCGDSVDDTFADHATGDGRGALMILRLTDGSGNVLQTPTGPAEDIRAAFGPLNFSSSTTISSPPIQVLSPKDPSHGVAFTVQYTTEIGGRAANCVINGLCEALAADGGGPPASLNAVNFDRFHYGQTIVSDILVTWSNQGGVLSLSQVHDESNHVDYQFEPRATTDEWGFAAATGLRAAEKAAADANGAETTAGGKYLVPTGISCIALLDGCDFYGVDGETFIQGGSPGAWTDLASDPAIFTKLPVAIYLTDNDQLQQPDLLAHDASIVTVDGHPATRLKLAGHWVNLVFNQLPADGEQWLFRFPRGGVGTDGLVDADTPRGPVPGQVLSVSIQGGTSELADANLNAISVVPNPFIAADEITRGRGLQRILFTNLPPQATIRIYTISGNLVRVLEHSDGSGTEEWDVRTRFDLLVASGNYYYHVTTPDGRTFLGRFAVIN